MIGSVLVDTDPSNGLFLRDVDDALAILHLHAWGAPLAGLTTCFGNAGLDEVTRIARDLGSKIGVPVHAGARRAGERVNAAVEALVAHRGTVLAIAPLTNVAAALERGATWERLVVLGGTERRTPNLRPLYTTELNFALDEAAASTALEATTDLVPMEVCRQIRFDLRDLGGLPPDLAAACRSWTLSSPLRTGRFSFHPWDLVAAAWLTHPALFTAARHRVALDSAPGWRGRVRFGPGSTIVLKSVDSAAFRALWHQTAVKSGSR